MGDGVSARAAHRSDDGSGLPGDVRPGPVEELARNDRVVIALGDEDGGTRESTGRGRNPGVEGERPVEDRRSLEPVGFVEQQSSGEGRPPAEADQDDVAPRTRDRTESGAKPGHCLVERRGDGAPDSTIGEPGIPAAFGDGRAKRRERGPHG